MSFTSVSHAPLSALTLDHPVSLGAHDRYTDAQAVVDRLADEGFPVADVMIVGTDLKQVERVRGRLTWPGVLLSGLLSGVWLGTFTGLVLSLFVVGTLMSILAQTVLWGALFGVVWAALGYALTRGRRDFTSVSTVVATRWEVLTEHRHAHLARDVLAGRVQDAVSAAAQGAPGVPTPGGSTAATAGTDHAPPAAAPEQARPAAGPDGGRPLTYGEAIDRERRQRDA